MYDWIMDANKHRQVLKYRREKGKDIFETNNELVDSAVTFVKRNGKDYYVIAIMDTNKVPNSETPTIFNNTNGDVTPKMFGGWKSNENDLRSVLVCYCGESYGQAYRVRELFQSGNAYSLNDIPVNFNNAKPPRIAVLENLATKAINHYNKRNI